MKIVLSSLMILAFACPSFAKSKQFTGACAKAAVDAAVTFWADVPNPDPNLEYEPWSAKPVSRGSNVYEVVLALWDGNDIVPAKYNVTFGDLKNCADTKVSY